MALRIANTRFVKCWKVEEGKFGKQFALGTSRKVKDTGEYKNSNWWNCRFVGNAKEFGDNLQKGDVIKIVSGQLENVYVKETGKTYFNLVVFEAGYEEGHEKAPAEKVNDSLLEDDISQDEFPF